MIVDLYAGPGGWDEGMSQHLGITDVVGIEYDEAACLTARAAGHVRRHADIGTVPTAEFRGASGLIASPPCQAWSMAGKRQGEADRARVHALVDAYANGGDDPGDGWADDRSHHAALPIRWVRDLRPVWVAFEQVPPVLPLWQHAAERMRRWGYSTWTGVLNAADYGVPQTRERAILVARLDGPALPPEPTHARHPRADLFGAELLPWVSMADALGWGMTDRWALRNGNQDNACARMLGEPSGTLFFSKRANWVGWVLQSGNQDNAAKRSPGEPAPTMAFGHNAARVEWVHNRPATTIQGDPRVDRPGHKDRDKGESQFEQDSVKITQAEAAVLQSFRPDYPWQGTKTKRFEQIGNAVPPMLAARVVAAAMGRPEPLDVPADPVEQAA